MYKDYLKFSHRQ